MLTLNKYDLRASLAAKFNFAMDIAKGKLSEQAIADWLSCHSRVRRKRR